MIRKARSLALYSSKAGAWHHKAQAWSFALYGSKGSELGLKVSEVYMIRKARSLALYSSKAGAWHHKAQAWSLALYSSKAGAWYYKARKARNLASHKPFESYNLRAFRTKLRTFRTI